jgi:hypothetical protein
MRPEGLPDDPDHPVTLISGNVAVAFPITAITRDHEINRFF